MSVSPLVIRYSDDPIGALQQEQFECQRIQQQSRWKPCFFQAAHRHHWSMSHHRHFGRDKQSAETVNNEGFQASVDVQYFAPNEITVKTVDNFVVVEAKHDDNDTHGQIFRHFMRRYELPKRFNSGEVHSTLSSDGYLTIKAPVPSTKPADESSAERVIQIQLVR